MTEKETENIETEEQVTDDLDTEDVETTEDDEEMVTLTKSEYEALQHKLEKTKQQLKNGYKKSVETKSTYVSKDEVLGLVENHLKEKETELSLTTQGYNQEDLTEIKKISNEKGLSVADAVVFYNGQKQMDPQIRNQNNATGLYGSYPTGGNTKQDRAREILGKGPFSKD